MHPWSQRLRHVPRVWLFAWRNQAWLHSSLPRRPKTPSPATDASLGTDIESSSIESSSARTSSRSLDTLTDRLEKDLPPFLWRSYLSCFVDLINSVMLRSFSSVLRRGGGLARFSSTKVVSSEFLWFLGEWTFWCKSINSNLLCERRASSRTYVTPNHSIPSQLDTARPLPTLFVAGSKWREKAPF